MTKKVCGLLVLVVVCACGWGRADFKYTENSKITGGAMAGVMKFAGVFSKKAREPMTSTVYVKGDRMRRDSADGNIEIIDLDGRRIIQIDSQKRTYSVMTFDQMRQRIELAKARAQEEEKKQAKEAKNPNVKITPKFRIEPGAGSRVILGQNTHEVKTTVDMVMTSDDPQTKNQSATFTMSSDMYIAPSVPGYQEMLNFNTQMAKELDWLPGEVFGGNPQIADARAEAAKHASDLKGFPLLQYTSFGGVGNGQGANGAQAQSNAQPQRQNDSQSSSVSPLNPEGAAVKALGGFFGHHKKKNADEQTAENQGSNQAAPPPSQPGSLMDMTIEVTNYSDSALDPSLFDVPSGYRQIEAPNRIAP